MLFDWFLFGLFGSFLGYIVLKLACFTDNLLQAGKRNFTPHENNLIPSTFELVMFLCVLVGGPLALIFSSFLFVLVSVTLVGHYVNSPSGKWMHKPIIKFRK